MMDCQIRVRNYVLIARPTSIGRQKKGVRIVVQSPSEISSDISQLPARLLNSWQQNHVFFLPKTDIDSKFSDAYEKEKVGRGASLVNAHGVALFQSIPACDLHYQKGDKFWISSEPITGQYENNVPVINLRTGQSGIIQKDQVCWVPKVRSPDGELWTLGGASRELKLEGKKKFRYWSWVVCQHLDGANSTTKVVEIPTSDVAVAGTSLLPGQESQTLFEQLYQHMQDRSVGISTDSSATFPTSLSVSLLPTPPTSPDVQDIQKPRTGKRKSAPSQPLPTSPDIQQDQKVSTAEGQRVGAEAIESRKRQMIHTQDSDLTQCSILKTIIAGALTCDEDATESDDSDSENDDDDDRGALSHIRSSPFNGGCSSQPTTAAQDEQLIIPKFSYNCVIDRSEMVQNENRPVICLTDPGMRDPTAAIAKCYEENRHRHRHNPRMKGLCHSNLPACPYITTSTRKHYHSPHEKCRRVVPGKMPDQFPHEHCISIIGPYPGRKGDCLLAVLLNSYPNHKCCMWHPDDLEGINIAPDHEIADRKLREKFTQKGSELHDTSSRVRLELLADFDVADNHAGNLDEGGMALLTSEDLVQWANAPKRTEAYRYAGKDDNWGMEFGLE